MRIGETGLCTAVTDRIRLPGDIVRPPQLRFLLPGRVMRSGRLPRPARLIALVYGEWEINPTDPLLITGQIRTPIE